MTEFATRDEATSALLGAVLLADTALDILTDERIQPEHFHRQHEQAIYRAMLAMRDAGEPIDALTLKARFGSPQSSVTPAHIAALEGGVPGLGNLRGYCRIVRDHHRDEHTRRALYEAGDAFERGDSDTMHRWLASIDDKGTDPDPVSAADEFVRWYEDDQKGIPLPFAQLTEAVGGGLQPGEVSIVGGWPGMRKTWWVKDMLTAASKAGARCHEWANEMSGPLRTGRLVASLTGIPTARLRHRQLSADDWKRVLAVLNSLPYETTATAGWSVEDYCRAMRRDRWDVAAIDTVTNLPCSKVDEWDRACTMLADTAAQTGTHLILVSQLNRERDTTAVKPPPTGRDLRNTGSWYMRARVVMFIHFDQELAEGTNVVKGLLPDGHVRVDKATHGDASSGYVDVTFNPKWLSFQPLDDYRRPEVAA